MNKTLCLSAILLLGACDGGGSTLSGSSPSSGLTPISVIQGAGDESPLLGESVTVSAIVTGDFQDNDADKQRNLGGFYVQQETADTDPRTSEGVFVFDGKNPTVDVDVGDRVEVTGTVAEHFSETQIAASNVRVTGSGSIQASDVNLPTAGVVRNSDGDALANLERYEGMLLRFPQTLTISNLRFLEQFGEVGLSQGGRLFQFTNSNPPGTSAYAVHKRDIAARSIVLDDGRRDSNPANNTYLTAGTSPDYSIRLGDSISGVTGNLRYSRGSGGGGDEAWRLMPTGTVSFSSDNSRPGPPNVGGDTRIASFNVLNFFSGIDRGRPVCGPRGGDNCRGADSAAELERQSSKTTTALAMMNADVVGLVELENNRRESIATIVAALNEELGSERYDFVDTGVIGEDAIKTGFIYDTRKIRLRGSFALLDATVDVRFNDQRNRPALAQTFEDIASGAALTVVVNHLKSKGSSCESDGDPNRRDGQGNCNANRTNAAIAIADWIATDPTGSGDADFLIIGDLNAYLMEDPLTAFKDAGLTNLLEANDQPYSFSFDGQSGALDHALASAGLVPQVIETIEWKINSDEPPILDYNLEHGRNTELFDPGTPFRASDHDPVIVGLDLTN